jgi:hypothetical protein
VLSRAPNTDLIIEPHPDIDLSAPEIRLFQALFQRYARLVLELEFRSGYSGARAFLAQPILADGRADAFAVAKVGDHSVIEREFANYGSYVEQTLPPVTARIQGRPVTAARRSSRLFRRQASPLAAIRYTFIGEPGRKPVSLHQQLLVDPDPVYLEKLFDTFGPNWWMQRRPHTFRLVQEYDRKLPSHYILEPTNERGEVLDGRAAPAEVDLGVGQVVTLRNFQIAERRVNEDQLSLRGTAQPGQAALRVRWLGLRQPEGAGARVQATRKSLLRDWTAEFDGLGLPDPLERLPAYLNEKVSGTQSIIHGDLNLENVLIGPGDFVWLIDFANTREGHPIFDFSHMAAEVIAHILSPRFESGQDYLAFLGADGSALMNTIKRLAGQCLFDPADPREYHLAYYISCLGALKYRNLGAVARYNLYLTAAWLADLLG